MAMRHILILLFLVHCIVTEDDHDHDHDEDHKDKGDVRLKVYKYLLFVPILTIDLSNYQGYQNREGSIIFD